MGYNIDSLLDYCQRTHTNISPQEHKDWAMFCCALKVLGRDESSFVALSNPGSEKAARAMWRNERNPQSYIKDRDAAIAKIVALAKAARVNMEQFKHNADLAKMVEQAAASGEEIAESLDTAAKVYSAMKTLDLDMELFPKIAGRFASVTAGSSVFKSREKAERFLRYCLAHPCARQGSSPTPPAADEAPSLPPLIVNPAFVERAAASVRRTSLCEFLCRYFAEEEVLRAMAAYQAGATAEFGKDSRGNWRGSAFPLINSRGEIIDVHLMRYKEDGRRLKSENVYTQNWLLAKYNSSDRRGKWPLFGEHLAAARPAAPIGIVESEKTAIVASIFFPSCVWCATQSVSNLTKNRLSEVKDRQIFLFPDRNGIKNWEAQADKLRAAGFKKIFLCSKLIIENAKREDADLADLIFDAISQQRTENLNIEKP